jgi:hypothetical protein
MPPRSERPFEEKSRCWFEKCILPISLFYRSSFLKVLQTPGSRKCFPFGLDLTVKPIQALPWARSSPQNAAQATLTLA